jgi:exopolysaccharide production protein ExoZ
MKERIESLDWLRGLMAISIMVYHLTGGLFSTLDSSSVLGRLGVYGVSVFFVLSGLSMAIVYCKYIRNFQSTTFFYVRRVFRIWPLLWVCIVLELIPRFLRGEPINIWVALANFTTVFGFVAPEAYINTGAWSIGNEMVYYALTPLILYFYNKKLSLGNLFTGATLLVALYFSFILLKPDDSLANQWNLYVNPLNSLFLYTAGIGMYYNFRNVTMHPLVTAVLLLTSILFFALYPVDGDLISIASGTNRVLFLFLCVTIVLSFYKFRLYHHVPLLVSAPLGKFGIATYGVYLLHPIVLTYLGIVFYKMGIANSYLLFFLVCASTVAVALFSYENYEKKMMMLGKTVTQPDRAFWNLLSKKQN